jgi:polysaccharide biosynthesis protein PelA
MAMIPRVLTALLSFTVIASLWLAMTAAMAQGTGQPEARVIVALYDSRVVPEWRDTDLHRLAEMPLNHLGLVVEPHDIRDALPDVAARPEVRGIITWWSRADLSDPVAYLAWADAAAAAGKKFAILGNTGFTRGRRGLEAPQDLIDRFLARFGVRMLSRSYDPSYSARADIKVSNMVEFERPLPPGLAIAGAVEAVNSEATVYLSATRPGSTASYDLVVVGPAGGLVAAGYTHYRDETGFQQWYLNPFAFFDAVFATADLPRPDVTTAMGRRVFLSHVDGEGWRNLTAVQPYRAARLRAIDVLIGEVYSRFPELPVTVAPVAADLDPEWCGDPAARDAAVRLFALPHVDAATHTYSQPYIWQAFTDERAAAERLAMLRCSGADRTDETQSPLRAYPREPFDLSRELLGSAQLIDTLLPPGKSVDMVLWSGDADPPAAALAMAAEAGLGNLNGGDPRFRGPYPSVASFSPLALAIGDHHQVYTAAANENLYTSLWADRVHGFRRITDMFAMSESPRRLKPIDVHYNVASGETLAGLRALQDALDQVRSQPVTPLTARFYAETVEGFMRMTLRRLDATTWQVADRGALQTLRFDAAEGASVDMMRSQGVLGWRQVGDVVYVALDDAVASPVVALARNPVGEAGLSLLQSRWLISGLETKPDGATFEAAGYGPGEMEWRVPGPGVYTVRAVLDDETVQIDVAASESDTIAFILPALSNGRRLTVSLSLPQAPSATGSMGQTTEEAS